MRTFKSTRGFAAISVTIFAVPSGELSSTTMILMLWPGTLQGNQLLQLPNVATFIVGGTITVVVFIKMVYQPDENGKRK